MSELENGWHLRSEGYIDPKRGYQRITMHMAIRELENYGRLVFIKFMGGKEVDSRVCKPVETCHYFPDLMHSYYDEDDNEIDTDEADPDGCHCSCDHCGYTMMTGELGWFDESPGEHGGIVYVPRFKHCPECGRSVER